MWLNPIQVQCQAARPPEQTPQRFLHEEHWIDVAQILDRWYQTEPLAEWPRADYFKVLCEQGRQYLLKHDLDHDQWYLARVW